MEDYSKDRITEVEGESFPSKGLPNLAPFYRVRFSFRFFASFFFLTDAWIWNPRLENIPENEDGVIIGGRNEKERERRI